MGVRADHDVLELQVTVHNALRVDVREGVADVVVPAADHLLVGGALRDVCEAALLAVGVQDEVHHEERPAGVLADVGDLDDARMRKPGEKPALGDEALAHLVVLVLVRICLQGVTRPDLWVEHFVHFAHPALAEKAHDFIFANLHRRILS